MMTEDRVKNTVPFLCSVLGTQSPLLLTPSLITKRGASYG
jgi:hypothetical protein